MLTAELKRQATWLSSQFPAGSMYSSSRGSEASVRISEVSSEIDTKERNRSRIGPHANDFGSVGADSIVSKSTKASDAPSKSKMVVVYEGSESLELTITTLSGAEYKLLSQKTDSIGDLISGIQKIDIEHSVGTKFEDYILLTSDMHRLGGSYSYSLQSFGIKDGDNLQLRMTRHPALIDVLDFYRCDPAFWKRCIVSFVFAFLGCLLLWGGAKLEIDVGRWWTDALGLSYKSPLTFETLVLALNASFLGYWGVLSVGLYLAAIALDLDVVAGGHTGPEGLYYSTAGYYAGFVVASLVAARLCHKGWDRRVLSSYVLMIVVPTVVYIFAVVWLPFGIALEFDIGVSSASCGAGDGCIGNLFMWGVVPFLFGDVVKSIAAMILLPIAWKVVAAISMRRFTSLYYKAFEEAANE